MRPYFFIRTDKQFVKISHDDIICIESLANYVSITTVNGNYMTLLSLRQLEEILPEKSFCRISKSCIASLEFIVSFDKEAVHFKNKKVAFGERYRLELFEKLPIVMSDVREKLKSLSIDTSGIKESIN
jgi:DNA-binding LytR/AlgR family response regulator